MALFKCSKCKLVYEDYYPPDDTCIKCKKGTVRIVQENHLLKGRSSCEVITSRK